MEWDINFLNYNNAMKIFGLFRLLTKTTFFYLIFILIAFFLSAHYLVHKANKYVTQETESIFKKRECHLTRYLNEYDSIKSFRTTHVELLNDICDTVKYPIYNDTAIYIEELDETQLHREKILVVYAKEKYFLVTMLVNIDDFTKLKQDVAKRVNPSFLLLAFVIVLFSIFMSGYLLKPFHRILEKMNNYQVGKEIDISDVKTSTLEFKKMQILFRHMTVRIEGDYRKLKEYTENMAHEIQTPLAIIRNKTERLIADENVMNEHKDSIKVIYDETNHLSKLGTTLNLLTKIENGEYTNTVNLKTYNVILKHIESVKELVELKSFQVEVQLNKDHEFLIDPFLFDIILKNILRNAIRYASNKGPIKLETDNKSLRITNFGEALDVSNNKIFERFYTSSNSGQSLGLGLALVKRICDLNHLQINYSYTEGQHLFVIDPLN